MKEQMMFVSVKAPETVGKAEIPDVEADTLFLQMVNNASRKRVEEQKKQKISGILDDLLKREAAVFRREQAADRKEARYRSMNSIGTVAIDCLLAFFATLGVVVFTLLCLGM